MKFGFIGAGNITSAIVTGLLKSKTVCGDCLLTYDKDNAAALSFHEKYGVFTCDSLSVLLDMSDVVVLAVKPHVYAGLLPEIKALGTAGKLFVSVAAGQTLARIGSLLGEDAAVIRVMPNVNAAVCGAVSALCPNAAATRQQIETVRALFENVGTVIDVEERLFATFAAIAGSSPAFTYLFIDALAKGALRNGMTKKTALAVASQAVLGSAKMLVESGAHPQVLIDSVCSPGGMTIDGICALEDGGFGSAVVKAVDAAVEKDKKLS